MNPVLMLVHGCCELTRKAIESVLAQDIPVKLWVIDNNSDDATKEMLASFPEVETSSFERNLGVSRAWNFALSQLFEALRFPYVLVLNNDIQIPPHFYRSLIETGEQFITGVSIAPNAKTYWSCGKQIPLVEARYKNPHPDFSAFLIRKGCWDRVGEFDQSMVYYAQDCDYHVRMNHKGIWAGSINLEFHHAVSSTVRSMSDEERNAILRQADMDRMVFRNKYGCEIGTSGYDELFR